MQGTWTDRRKFIITSVVSAVAIILLIVFDQITKIYFKTLYEGGEWVKTTIIPNFFEFRYTVNTGAAWSFLAGVSWAQTFFKILTAVSLIAFFAFFVYALKKRKKVLIISLILIIAGTIGNFIDRLAYNGVVDFISLIFGDYYFPIFNLADSFMTVGIILMIIHYFFLDENKVFTKNGNKDD
ncbi:MAG: signal peptidase II [Clostridiales bacterium]|nr:signal peptidase II [Clostridiales bacterium]